MTTLTSYQTSLLNTRGLTSLMAFRADGTLPECPAVQARISERAYQENPANWKHGEWFRAEHRNSRYRTGSVRVRRDETPFGILYRVLGHRWCDTYDESKAKHHLRAVRDSYTGQVTYLEVAQARQADRDYQFELSR